MLLQKCPTDTYGLKLSEGTYAFMDLRQQQQQQHHSSLQRCSKKVKACLQYLQQAITTEGDGHENL